MRVLIADCTACVDDGPGIQHDLEATHELNRTATVSIEALCLALRDATTCTSAAQWNEIGVLEGPPASTPVDAGPESTVAARRGIAAAAVAALSSTSLTA